MIIDGTYVKLAINHYKQLGIENVECQLLIWLDPTWINSIYSDILIPTLIERKLELNEQEY